MSTSFEPLEADGNDLASFLWFLCYHFHETGNGEGQSKMKQFLSYGESAYEIEKEYLSGFVQNTIVHYSKASYESGDWSLPTQVAKSEPIAQESQRSRRKSPLQFLRNLYELAKKEQKHVVCALTFEAAHIHEDLATPTEPFLEFKVVDAKKVSTSSLFHSPERAEARAKGCPSTELHFDSSPDFSKGFQKAKEHFAAGDAFELVLSRKLQFKTHGAAMAAFLASTMEHKLAPYRFALNFRNTTLVGASPELLVKVEGTQVVSRPISGSIRRTSADLDLNSADQETLGQLLRSEKEKSELDMLIDLARNDLHHTCKQVEVKYYRDALILETVAHTQATVVGQLDPKWDAIDVLLFCLNAGTLVGAPKKKGMEIISSIEKTPRGYYGGNLVHIFPNGDIRVTILIRTAIIQNDVLTVQSGATLLNESNEQYEYWECGAKMQSLLKEIGQDHLCFNQSTPPNVVMDKVISDPFSAHCQSFEKTIASLSLPPASKRVLLIDNQDSFTFNLCALFERLGCEMTVVRNHLPMVSLEGYQALILSPGPSSPEQSGHLLSYVKMAAGRIPVFGVCLGLQAMVMALGGELGRLSQVQHGKRTRVKLDENDPLFKGMGESIEVGRYHSLFAKMIPGDLTVIAKDELGIPMAIRGPKNWPLFLGVQFHPESFLTGPEGCQIAARFLVGL